MTGKNDWTVESTRELFDRAAAAREKGESLSVVFAETAKRTGRSINSVRNFYYGQSKTFELVPDIAKQLGIRSCEVRRDAFVPFSDAEIKRLLEEVLTKRAQGYSVRAVINMLAAGDAKVALRLQNKYRSLLRSHRDTVESVMADLDRRGIDHIDPYTVRSRQDNFARLTEYIASLDESKVGSFLSLIEKLS